MAEDERLSPGLGGTQHFGQETSPISGPFPLDAFNGYGSDASKSLVGQDYTRLVDPAGFTTTPEVVFTDDGSTPIPFIPVYAQARQPSGGDPLLGSSSAVLPDANDSLLSGGDPKVDSVQSSVVIPLEVLPQLVENVAKKVLASMPSQPTNVYNLNHSQFGGGFAETVHGNQVGGAITNNGGFASQSRLFDLIEKDIVGIITKLPREYSVRPDTPPNRIDMAVQVIAEIERRPDMKHELITSLRSLEAENFRLQSVDPVVNIVLAAFARGN